MTNCGDWDGTYYSYYDGWKVVELRDGSEQVLKQYTWGRQYMDELLLIAINQDPQNAYLPVGLEENLCERFFWVLQDANYNVLGLVNAAGKLIERYEYTPYGQRTIFSHGWNIADLDGDGDVDGADSGIMAADMGNYYKYNPGYMGAWMTAQLKAGVLPR